MLSEQTVSGPLPALVLKVSYSLDCSAVVYLLLLNETPPPHIDLEDITIYCLAFKTYEVGNISFSD